MGGEPGPYIALRRLCLTLRRAREGTALTQAQVAERLSWSTSKLARIESGQVGIGLDDIQAPCLLYGLGPAVIEELARLADVAKRRGWWHEFREDFPEPAVTLFAMEAEANRLRMWRPLVVPGLFQTAAYAEAVLLESYGDLDEVHQKEARRRLTARLGRNDIMFARPDPPELVVCLDEPVLYRVVGGRSGMVEQIRQLAELSRRPNVALRIRPFESAVGPGNEFVLVDFDTGDTAVYGEDFTSSFSRDDEETGTDRPAAAPPGCTVRAKPTCPPVAAGLTHVPRRTVTLLEATVSERSSVTQTPPIKPRSTNNSESSSPTRQASA